MSYQYHSIKNTTIQIPQICLRSVSFSKDDSDWGSILHTHGFTELFLVVNGKGNFLFKDSIYPIKSGDLIIIPPYVGHSEQSLKDTPLEYYVLGIDGIIFTKKGEQTAEQIFFHLKNKAVFTDLFSQILREARRNEYGADAICQHLLKILIVKITRLQNLVPLPVQNTHIAKECAYIKQYLDSHYSDRITLNTLARLTHMNKYYIARSFTKYVGIPPIQYLNLRRLDAACMLLKDTDHSLSNIASIAGFSSQTYFSQAFRNQYGIAPLRYRYLHSWTAPTSDR
ncbi:helix-turn-helix transcriptional regulator [Mediterraneibacter massiliensis]|uniref:helix-turn-helix transcriptional regulator n=1 Tax=Mediterraneibacter massiliensis TaxID=1720300 RepID=UPI00073F6606|nr:AraC family transcriptional regulator [Mediterraneibacter massiliensis]